MFSVEDSFELSEEDFLQAALDIESRTKPNDVHSNNNTKLLTSVPCAPQLPETQAPGIPPGSQLSSGLESESQTPLISLVAPCHRHVSGPASSSPSVVSPKIGLSITSPEAGTSATMKKFHFKRSPNTASAAISPGTGISNASLKTSISPGIDNTTPMNKRFSPGSTKSPDPIQQTANKQELASAGQRTDNVLHGISNGQLFVVSQDSCDSDLDFSLDSNPLNIFGPKSPVQSTNYPKNIDSTRNNSHRNTTTTVISTSTSNKSQSFKELPLRVNQTMLRSHTEGEFKTPNASPAVSRLRNPGPFRGTNVDTPTTTRRSMPADGLAEFRDVPPGRPGCSSWDTPTTYVSPVPSTTSLTSSMGKRKRKFPGPAGLLPKLKRGLTLEDANRLQIQETPTSTPTAKEPGSDFPNSQSSEDSFIDGPWKKMTDDLEPEANKMLEEFSISSIQKKAAKKLLARGKVPVVCVLIDIVSLNNDDASVVLKDKTGNMKGTIHRQVMKDYPADMISGTVLVLRQVGVFSPSNRNHYLNITPNNIVRIYTKAESGGVRTCKLAEFSPDDYVLPELIAPSPLQSSLLSPSVPGLGPAGFSARPGPASSPAASFSTPPYQFRPRSANNSSPLFGNRPNFPSPAATGQQHRGKSTPVNNYRPYMPQTRLNSHANTPTAPVPGPRMQAQRLNVPSTMAHPRQSAPPRSMAVQAPRNPTASAQSLNQSGSSFTFRAHSTSSIDVSNESRVNNGPLAPGQPSGKQPNTGTYNKTIVPGTGATEQSVEELWQENDEQLDDLLTGIGDELFDPF